MLTCVLWGMLVEFLMRKIKRKLDAKNSKMVEYIQALNSPAQSSPINCADGDSVLALLYKAYSGTHPLEDTAIKQAFADLYLAMNGMALPEMDQIL